MKYITSLLLFCITLICSAQSDESLLKEVALKYEKAVSVDYDINYGIKHFDNDSIIRFKGNCKILRQPKDTVYKASIWVDVSECTRGAKYDVHCYYNNNSTYIIADEDQTIMHYNLAEGDYNQMNSYYSGEMINTFFLNSGKMISLNKKISDTIISGKPYLKVIYPLPDGNDLNRKLTAYINKEKKLVERITFLAHLKDQYQYNEWLLSNISFNTVNQQQLIANFSKYSYRYKIVEYEEESYDELFLEQGTEAPAFTAKLYDGKPISLKDYKGKIVLLDFYYMACMPCQEAAPKLSALQQKYKDQIVVIGLNPVDEYTKAKQKLDAYTKRAGITYTVASATEQISESYLISGYPSLYLIDKNGIIKHHEGGYSDTMEEELDAEIQKLLKE